MATMFALVPFAPASADEKVDSLTVDADEDRMADAREDELLTRYAPKVVMHPQESYKMSNVDAYLAQTEMRFNRKGGCADYSVIAPGSNNQGQLVNQSRYEHSGFFPFCGDSGNLIRSTDNRTDYTRDGFFLHHPDDSREDAIRKGDLNTAVVYGHAFPRGGVIELQYWFFYGYDNYLIDNIAHEGDWENIVVEVDPTFGEFKRAYYNAHGTEGKWYTADQLRWANNAGAESSSYGVDHQHPVVYAALGKHASYPTTGTQTRPNGILDWTGDGDALKSWEPGRLTNVGETWAPRNGQQFIRYGGLWGEIGEFSWTSGPAGPAFQSGWGTPSRGVLPPPPPPAPPAPVPAPCLVAASAPAGDPVESERWDPPPIC